LVDPLTPLTTPAGVVPPGFPARRVDVVTLSGPDLQRLLTAYGQAVPRELSDRRRAFAVFAGVRLS